MTLTSMPTSNLYKHISDIVDFSSMLTAKHAEILIILHCLKNFKRAHKLSPAWLSYISMKVK